MGEGRLKAALRTALPAICITPVGGKVMQIGRNGSGSPRIAKAPYLIIPVGGKVIKYGGKGRRRRRIAKAPYWITPGDDQVWRPGSGRKWCQIGRDLHRRKGKGGKTLWSAARREENSPAHCGGENSLYMGEEACGRGHRGGDRGQWTEGSGQWTAGGAPPPRPQGRRVAQC